MGKRFLRLMAGLLLLVTLPVNIPIFLIIWIITGKSEFSAVLNWVTFGVYEYD